MNNTKFLSEILQSFPSDLNSISNKELYSKVATKTQTPSFVANNKAECTKDGKVHNLFNRKVRWAMQTLKADGAITSDSRGFWRLTQDGKQTLTTIVVNKHMVAASTDLGVVIWGDSTNVFNDVIEEDIHLCFTSAPYLGIKRSYGTHQDEADYIDFILSVLEPVRKRMVKGANLVLNVTNDSILKKSFGERSLYLEKLIISMSEKLELHLMDRLPWYAADKSPKGYQVTHARTHLTSRYEPVLWFCNEPEFCLADNRRVLEPYKAQMKRIIEAGGEKSNRVASDYQTNSKKGGFSTDNGGSIPSNVLNFPTNCANNRAVIKNARSMGLPTHGALFPQALAEHIIKWMCPPGGLVHDPFGGYSTTGAAAEKLGMNWRTVELHWEYVRASLVRFEKYKGYEVNPELRIFDDLIMPGNRFYAN